MEHANGQGTANQNFWVEVVSDHVLLQEMAYSTKQLVEVEALKTLEVYQPALKKRAEIALGYHVPALDMAIAENFCHALQAVQDKATVVLVIALDVVVGETFHILELVLVEEPAAHLYLVAGVAARFYLVLALILDEGTAACSFPDPEQDLDKGGVVNSYSAIGLGLGDETVVSFCLVLEVVLAEEELSFCPALELGLDEEGEVCSCPVLDLHLDEKVEISFCLVLDLALDEKDEVSSCHALELALDGVIVASSYLVLVRISSEHCPPAIGVCLGNCVQLVFCHLLHGVLPELYMKHSDERSLLALGLDAAVNSPLYEGSYFLGLLLQIVQLAPAKFYQRIPANFYLNPPPMVFERYLPPLSSGVLAVVNSLPVSACASLL